MTLRDLDMETRKVVYLAHLIASRPSDKQVITRLQLAIIAFDAKHAEERENNLLSALADVLEPPHAE